MKNRIYITIFCSLFSFGVSAQDSPLNGVVVQAKVVEGDTIPFATLPVYDKIEKRTFRDKMAQRKYESLKRKVITVYPYAKLAGEKLRYHEAVMSRIKTEQGRKKYAKKVEKDIEKTFGPELRDMTVSEGVILIKLIDRETGDTSYSLLQELRGGFSAFFWQSLARVFGHNLKSNYDAQGDEKTIEEIIDLIDRGVYEVAELNR